jgi:hypothetical protein
VCFWSFFLVDSLFDGGDYDGSFFFSGVRWLWRILTDSWR